MLKFLTTKLRFKMKRKITSLLTVVLVLTMSLSFQSCSEDQEIGYTLAGTWEGNLGIEYEYDNQRYQSVYSEVYFENDPFRYTSGDGYWIDYYRDYGWGRNYIANHITWKVRNQVIYIHFVEENSNIEIGNYRLDDDYFTGVIYLDGRSARFSLKHTSSPNWNNYVFGYDGFYDYGWAKSDGPANPVSAPRRHLGNPDEIAK